MACTAWFGALESVAILLITRLKTRDVATAQRIVLGFSPGNALAPHQKAAALHVAAHQLNNLRFAQAKLALDRLETSAILPRHANDAVNAGVI